MDRKAFGRLLAALRDELGWTQAYLAELVDVAEAVISQLERGAKRQVDPALIFKLANALQLTTLERREFFLASSGLEPLQIARQPNHFLESEAFDHRKILAKASALVGQMRMPAFLVDVYGDLLAANRIVLDLMQFAPDLGVTDARQPGAYSAFRLVFGEGLRATISEGHEAYLVNIMRAFREVSLRYRAQPYFKFLMKEFRNPNKYPWFARVWRKVSLLDDDKFAAIDPFVFQHAVHGKLMYNATSSVLLTPYGELFLVHYIALDERTTEVFEQIARRVGPGALRFAPWPEKNMP